MNITKETKKKMHSTGEPRAISEQPKVPLPSDLSEPPAIAWPTIALAATTITVYLTFQVLYATGRVPYYICFPLWAYTAYVAFTPVHDATHLAIATKRSGYRAINDVIGNMCACLLGAPFSTFRYLHLQHHKYTNIEGYDPDMWSGGNRGTCPMWQFPLRWWSQIVSYYVHYFVRMRERPVGEAIWAVTAMFSFHILPLILHFGYGISYPLYCHMLPGILAIGFLAMVFDYVPHRPHQTSDVYKGSNVTTMFGSESVLTPILLYQNYHNIHHLYPWLPFYRYSAVWYRLRDQLIEKGTVSVPLLPILVRPA